MQVNIFKHKDFLGKNEERHIEISNIIDPIIKQFTEGAELDEVRVFNLLGANHDFKAGNNKNLIIYINGTSGASEWTAQEKGESIAGIETSYNVFASVKGDGNIILSDSGLPIAEYRSEHNELNILFQLDEATDEEIKAVFTYIMEQYHELVVKPLIVRHSWKLTHDKDGLTRRFTDTLKQAKERELRQDRERIARHEEDIRHYTREIKKSHDNLIRTRQNMENADKLIAEAGTRLVADLDLIVEHPKVKDLQIKDGKFIVMTDDIYCHHDRTGDRYYMGQYRIELKPENTEVKWFNLNNARNGYFSGGKNQHPHINSRGEACMGNISATLAELSSRMELYALVMMAIDFVESVNTSDPAGARIINWDKVDEEGNIIQSGHTCPNCGRSGATDIRRAYRLDGDGDLDEPFDGCSECTEWDERTEEYVEVQD